MNIIRSIYNNNRRLFVLGAVHLGLFLLLLAYAPFNGQVVLGLNSVVKPMKFALSIAIFAWTMAIFLQYLDDKRKVRAYTTAAIYLLAFEQFVITAQALRGRMSHFNVADAFSAILFALMGIAIVTLIFWTAYITYLFFKQKHFTIPPAYLWGIRLGLIIFIVFSLEGGMMARRLAHTIGAPDGGAGLPFVNWSTRHGDLRTAHFIGMHALQIIPLIGFVLGTRLRGKASVILIVLISVGYAGFTAWLFMRALSGLPLGV